MFLLKRARFFCCACSRVCCSPGCRDTDKTSPLNNRKNTGSALTLGLTVWYSGATLQAA